MEASVENEGAKHRDLPDLRSFNAAFRAADDASLSSPRCYRMDRGLINLLLRSIALSVAIALFAAPMAQSNVLVTWAEECGSKPPPLVEEESYKSGAPARPGLPPTTRLGGEVFGHHGHFYFPSPVREVLTPPPDRG
jgi:hypothetical protein